MVLLVHPLAVALEVDLCGGRGLAVQVHRLVLHDVALLGLEQEVGQGLWGVRGEGLGELPQAQEVVVVDW